VPYRRFDTNFHGNANNGKRGDRAIAREDRRKIDMMRSFVEFFVLNRRTSWTRNRNPSIPLEKELAVASWLRL
jgi:hypothetical protein